VILAWHVDYWDRLGWPDPFGAAEHTARQRRYAKARGARGVYTPQLVVANQDLQAAGGGPAFGRLVAEELAKAPQVAIDATVEAAGGAIEAAVRLEAVEDGWAPPEGLQVLAVLYQREATTECPAGENAGRTLEEVFVVRAAAEPRPVADGLAEGGVRFELEVPAGVEVSNLGVAVLVEDPAGMRTVECRAFPLGE